MCKRAQNDSYLDIDERETRLYDGPVLSVPFPNKETLKKSIILEAQTYRMASRLIPVQSQSLKAKKKRLKEIHLYNLKYEYLSL